VLRSDDRPTPYVPPQSLVKFGPRTPENRPEKMCHPLKTDGRSVLNRQ